MTAVDAKTRFKKSQDTIGSAIGDELVMMSIDRGQYYGLGGVGPRVWELIDQPRTFERLIELILEEYEVEREVCEKDLAEFLQQMEELGLVQRC